MVWWWAGGWTSGLRLTIESWLYALERHGHAITTTDTYQTSRFSRRPVESYRFCDARFAEARR